LSEGCQQGAPQFLCTTWLSVAARLVAKRQKPVFIRKPFRFPS
jgi:hypothetical protein